MSVSPFLDLEELRFIVARVDLPRFRASVYEDEFLGPHLRLVGALPDNTDPSKTVDLGIDAKIPPCRTTIQFLDWFLHRWIEIWIHEAREMFVYEEGLYSDPHAE